MASLTIDQIKLFEILHNSRMEDFKTFNKRSYRGVWVSIRPRACFFPLFSFLPLWLHYNLNPLCVQY